MMRVRAVAFLAAVLSVPAQAMAQGKSTEIGTNAGLTIFTGGGATSTAFSVPGAGVGGAANLYASFFGAKAIFIEPSAGLNIAHTTGVTLTNFAVAGTVGYLLKKNASIKGAYVAGDAALDYLHAGGGSATDFGLGGKVGYRCPIGNSLAARFEGGFRKWLSSGGAFGTQSEITLGVGLGVVRHSSSRATPAAPARRR
jgi:hypothetical protein